MKDDTPVTAAEALLQTYLERPLSPAELGELRAATEQDPELVSDAALIGLLRELRLERRIAKNEDSAWQAFSKLANQAGRTGQVSTPGKARWKHWIAQLRSPLQPAMPALAALVIFVQAGGLIWLSFSHTEDDGASMRGGSTQTCPAVLARFRLDTTLADVSQVLIQTQANIVSGPDAAGYYRIGGSAAFVREAKVLLHTVASEILPAPDCNPLPK